MTLDDDLTRRSAEALADVLTAPLVRGPAGTPLDAYDAMELLGNAPDHPSRLLIQAARRVADLWNDPPHDLLQRAVVRELFPELADALDDLLGGGPNHPPLSWDDVRPASEVHR